MKGIKIGETLDNLIIRVLSSCKFIKVRISENKFLRCLLVRGFLGRVLFLILAFNFLIISCVFADYKIQDFNGVGPQSHINKIYSEERKNELKNGDIKYDDIADMIHLYNPEVLNSWNTWDNNKSNQDIYDDLIEAADRIADSVSGDSEFQDAMQRSQSDAMRIQADKNISDSYVDFLTNYLNEMKLVLSTKLDYINYYKSNFDLLVAQENYNEAMRASVAANNNYNVGNATQIERLTAQKELSDANSAIVTASSAQNSYKRNLIVNCGRSMKDEVNILPVDISSCDVEIANIDFAKDYDEALKNSIQYEIYKKGKENARTKEVQNEYQILLDAAPQKIYNSLESNFNNILDAMDSKNNRMIAFALANDTYENAKNNFANGNISEREYKSALYGVNVAKYNLESAKYDVKIALENYKAVVNGFGDC